ncbi:MAG TPA: hypothetical protein VJS92_04535, partial [Candidatus Polarisedimenticolaceae bacterium]|nr:hypothetical protein [Candidatus Polarisedimenticolaceae bacterium]
LPVVLYQGLANGEWVPVSANGGMNFWVGNNRHAEGVYYAAEFIEQISAEGEERGFLAEARRRAGDPALNAAGASGFWFHEGLREIAAAPGRWARIEGRKLALFWNRDEAKTNVGDTFMRGLSPALRFAPGFGVVATLGLAGFARGISLKKWRPVTTLAGFVLVPLATCLLFFVSGEYRHPAVLPLCVAAGMLLADLPAAARQPRSFLTRGWAWTAAVAAGGFSLVCYDFPPLRLGSHPRLDYSNYAKAIAQEGDPRHPDEAPFARALALLDHPRGVAPDDLFLEKARLWVCHRASLVLRSPVWVERELDQAARLLGRNLDPPQRDYPPRFLLELQANLRQGLGELAQAGFVRDDPRLREQLEALRQRAHRIR